MKFTIKEKDYLSKILESIAVIENQHRDEKGRRVVLDQIFLIDLIKKIRNMSEKESD